MTEGKPRARLQHLDVNKISEPTTWRQSREVAGFP